MIQHFVLINEVHVHMYVTDRQIDTQNDYCNPFGACAPRVNYTHGGECTRIHTAVLTIKQEILVLC